MLNMNVRTSRYLPVNCANDDEMVNEGLRVPLIQKVEHGKIIKLKRRIPKLTSEFSNTTIITYKVIDNSLEVKMNVAPLKKLSETEFRSFRSTRTFRTSSLEDLTQSLKEKNLLIKKVLYVKSI